MVDFTPDKKIDFTPDSQVATIDFRPDEPEQTEPQILPGRGEFAGIGGVTDIKLQPTQPDEETPQIPFSPGGAGFPQPADLPGSTERFFEGLKSSLAKVPKAIITKSKVFGETDTLLETLNAVKQFKEFAGREPTLEEFKDLLVVGKHTVLKRAEETFPPPEEGGFATGAGQIVGFATKLAATRALFGGTPEILTWELQGELSGQAPGTGAAEFIILQAVTKSGKAVFKQLLNKYPKFNRGWEQWTKGKSAEQVKTARQEVDEALKIYKDTGDRAAWDAARIKFAGITPEGVEKIAARATPPEVKGFGKFPITKAQPPAIQPTGAALRQVAGEIKGVKPKISTITPPKPTRGEITKELQPLAEKARKSKDATEFTEGLKTTNEPGFQGFKEINVKMSPIEIQDRLQEKIDFENIKFTSGEKITKPGRKITKPIRIFINEDGSIDLEDGAHRLAQAIINKDKSIPVKIMFSENSVVKFFDKAQPPAVTEGKVEPKEITLSAKEGDIVIDPKTELGVGKRVRAGSLSKLETAFQRRKLGIPPTKTVGAFLKKFARTIPEFTIEPEFTVDKEKFLVFQDGGKFRINSELFGIDPKQLEVGQKVKLDIESFGIKEASKAAIAKAAPFLGEVAEKPPTKEPKEVGAARLKIELETEFRPKGKPVSKREIIDSLSSDFGIPIRGFVTHKEGKRLGFFKLREKGIRQRDVRDIAVGTHEIGHAVDRAAKPNIRELAPEETKRELLKLGKDLYGKRVPPGGFISEGAAEYIRLFLTTERSAEAAPKFDKWFREKFLADNPDIAKKLEKNRSLISDFRFQGPQGRVKAFIARKPIKGTIGERIEKLSLDLETAIRDRFAPLRRGIEAAGIERSKLKPTEDPFFLATVFSEKAGQKAKFWALEGTTNLAGTKTGPGLKEIFKDVKNVEEWEEFAVASRALELNKQGRQSGLTNEDASAVVDARKDRPGYEKALEEFTKWNQAGLDLLVESGAMTQELVTKIKKDNPTYVPFMRSFKPGEIRRFGGEGRGLTPGSPVKKLVGSGREVLPPIDSAIQQAERIISTAQKSMITKSLVNLEERFGGLSKLIERIPPPMKATTFQLEQIKKQLAENGLALGFDIEKFTGKPGELMKLNDFEDIDTLVTVFTNAPTFTGKENVISFKVGDQRRFYEVSPELYNVLKGMDSLTLPWLLDWVFAKPTRLVRLGATGLNASFGLIRNFLRDAGTFAITSKHAKLGPLSAVIGVGKDVKSKVSGIAKNFGTAGEYISEKVIKPDPDSELFSALGGEMSSFILRDVAGTKHLRHKILASDGVTYTIDTFLHPIDALRNVFGLTEAGARIGEFAPALKKGEKKFGKGTPDAAFFALGAGQDVTVNFSRAGNVSRIVNQGIAFFNAAIQGVDKIARTFHDRPFLTMLRGLAYLTVPALLLWWRNKDKAWYKSLPGFERANYQHIQVSEDRIVRFPTPFELGHLFIAAPISAIDATYRKDPGIIKETFSAALETANPLDWPNVVGPIIDLKANENFAGRPITPRNQIDKLPEDRVKPSTRRLMIFLGGKMGMSPIELQHLANSYTGGLYERLDRFTQTADKEGQLSDIPVIGTLFLRDPYAPKRDIELFYNRLELLRQKKKSKKITVKELREVAIKNKLSRALSQEWRFLRTAKTIEDRKKIYARIKRDIEIAKRNR